MTDAAGRDGRSADQEREVRLTAQRILYNLRKRSRPGSARLKIKLKTVSALRLAAGCVAVPVADGSSFWRRGWRWPPVRACEAGFPGRHDGPGPR